MSARVCRWGGERGIRKTGDETNLDMGSASISVGKGIYQAKRSKASEGWREVIIRTECPFHE